MKDEIGAYEAKTRLPELLRQVKAGRRFTITHRGEAIADLVPSQARGRMDAQVAIETFASFLRENPVTERVDLKALIEGLLGDAKAADRKYAQAALHALKRPDARAVVPVTWGLEVANVLARAEARAVLTEAQSEAFLEMLRAAPIHVDDVTFARALTDTLHAARRYDLSSYDASYLELDLRIGLPLATPDVDLAKAARKAGVGRFTVT